MPSTLRALIIEDLDDDALLIVRELKRAGYQVAYQRVVNLQSLTEALDSESWDLILSDYALPSFNAPAALKLVQQRGLDIPFIIISGTIDEETAVEVMKAGAHDYFAKDKLTRLIPAVERELREAAGRRQRRQAEAELRLSEQRFAKAFHASPVATVISTMPEGRYLDVNQRFLEFTGYTREEVIGHTSLELNIWADRELRELLGKTLLEHGTVSNIEARFRGKSGEIADALVSIELIDLNNRPHALTMAYEITDRKRAEQALRENEEKFRLLAENSTDIISRQTLERVFLYVSPASTALLGYTPEEMIGRSMYHFVHPDDVAPIKALQEQILNSVGGNIASYRLRRKDGSYTWFEAICRVARDPQTGQALEIQSSARDITERKQSEVATQQLNRQLEQRNRELVALYDIGRILGSTLNVREIHKVIYEEVAQKLLGAAHLTIALYDDGEQRIRCAFAIIDGEEADPAQFPDMPLGDGPTSDTIRTRQPRIVDLAETRETFRPADRVVDGEKRLPMTAIYVPMISGDRVIAVICAQHYDSDAFKDTDVVLLSTIASQAAVALENAQLYTAVRGYAEELEERVIERTQQLQQAKERVEVIFNNSSDAIALLSQSGAILRMNPAFEQLFGSYIRQNGDHSLLAVVRPEHVPALADALHTVTQGGESTRHEFTFRSRDMEFDADLALAPVKQYETQEPGVIVSLRDITERKRAEERQRSLVKGLRAVVTAANELMNVPDEDTVVRRAVEIARSHIGLERCAIFLRGEEKDELRATYGTDMQGETTDERSHRVLVTDFQWSDRLDASYGDGKMWVSLKETLHEWKDYRAVAVGEGWVASTIIPAPQGIAGVLFNDAAITGAPLDEVKQEVTVIFCSLLGNILELKRAEAALKQERNLLRTLIDNLPDYIYVKDTETCFVMVNQALRDVLGADSLEDVIGKTDFDFYPPELAQLYNADDRNVIQSGTALINREEPGLDSEGNSHIILTTKVPLKDANGEIIGLVGIGRNITEQKEIEQNLRRTLKKEKELNELKSRFTSMASHELRTPLSAIMSSNDLLRSYLHRMTEERRLEHFDKIEAQVKRLIRMLDDILVLSKAEAVALVFEPVQLDLKQFCQEIIEEMQLISSTHQLSLSYKMECGEVLLDPELLRQILVNLVSNAIKYSPDGGSVQLELECQPQQVKFSLRDEGIGIALEDQQHLFDTFYRASNISGIPGTGLGLSIVKRAVDAHGGTITIESEIGKGSTFIVSLPLLQPLV